MKTKHLVVILSVVVAAAVVFHWPRTSRTYDIPPAMDAERLRSLPDQQLVYEATTELRWSLADVPTDEISRRWRAWPEPARHLLTLSWLESDNGPADTPVFTGFANLLANTAPQSPDLPDAEAAYRAIGAAEAAAVVADAQRIAAEGGWKHGSPAPDGANPFSALDRKLRQKALACGATKLVRAYVRAHIEDIARVRNPEH